jgi:SAM-dependent methyltransferase
MKVTEVSDPTGFKTLNVIGKANKFNHWMYSAIEPFCNGEILEVGSGIGNISTLFIENGSNIHLSDIRQEYCEYLTQQFSNYPNFKGVARLDLLLSNFEEEYQRFIERFDTVFFLNVLEHIDDHRLAVSNANKLLKPGGKLIILVPAYPALFCQIDKGLGHFRRYTSNAIKEVILSGNYQIEKSFHFNACGIVAWFIAGKLLRKKSIEEGKMSLFNSFVPVFKFFDRIIFRKIGLSLIIVASKPVA